jgi:predicted metal-dependent enzyme (double-stranded beta helix superfamily)
MEPEPDSFRQFVMEMSLLVENAGGEPEIIDRGKKLLKTLVSDYSWLADIFIQHNSESYSQNLLYLDPQERFSIICFVWGPGQHTPIHNHTVWGLVGVIKGEERCDEFEVADGIPVYTGRSHKMIKGQVDAVSPTIGDWHRVSNPTNDVSISIHVYGANIGKVVRRKVGVNQNVEDFVSGYSSECVFRS